MNILVAVFSYYKNLNKTRAVINTWWKDITYPHKKVICGDIETYNALNNETVWVCGSGCNNKRNKLSLKTLNMFRIALADNSWDFIIKCDDDTYLNFHKLYQYLSIIDSKEFIYIGRKMMLPKQPLVGPFANGGAGYVLSRNAVIKAWNNLENLLSNTSGSEDRSVGESMTQSNIPLINEQQFSWGRFFCNDPDEYARKEMLNGNISSHYVSPEYMYKICKDLSKDH